jgi:hypothetical protein
VLAQGDVVDLCDGRRQQAALDPAILSPSSYVAGQALGREAREAGAPGIAYASVRDRGGECLAAFRTTLLRDCHHAAYLEYEWNGETVINVFEMSKVG